MLSRFFSISATDSDTIERGKLLKGLTLLIALATGISLISFVANANVFLISTNSLILALCVGVFALAHTGRVNIGGLLLTLLTLCPIVITSWNGNQSMEASTPMYIVPILIAALIIGSTSVMWLSVITVGILFMPFLVGRQPWSTFSAPSLLIIVLITSQIWLIIYRLERALGRARRDATAAQAAQQELTTQQAALQTSNQELTSANTQMSALLSLVRDLETPTIPLLDGVLVLPLVGHVDTRRAAQLTESVLTAVHQQRARTVIIDITGVSTVDTAVAQRIEQLAQAVRMLGAQVVLSGIRAEIAQTMVVQGINFTGIATTGRLQDGVALVLNNHAAADRPAFTSN
jgi:rsbT co-antagonist protein RsbR